MFDRHHSSSSPARGALFGLTAAALFGASAPIAKLLLPNLHPLMMASLLYLGAGLSLLGYLLVQRKERRHEAKVRRTDVGYLLGIIVSGGILGPVLMLVGINRLSAVSGSLLLNLEAPFTMLIAVVLFREHIGRHGAMAITCVLAGAVILGFEPGEMTADPLGIAAISGACLAWGFDNNLTQRLSLRDPVVVVCIKTLGAGVCTLVAAVVLGNRATLETALPVLILGVFGYGMSVLLDLYALRILGAVREATYFATAPFVGALLAIPLHSRGPTVVDIAAGVVMILGVFLLLRERHCHFHTHEALLHDHMHVHDEHHQHTHNPTVNGPHSHLHQHEPLGHEHAHVPDVHHRHRH